MSGSTNQPAFASWPRLRLKTLFSIVNGATPRSDDGESWDGDIPWITPDDLGKLTGDTITETRRLLTEKGYQNCGTTLVPAGSLVLSTRAPIGYAAIAGVPLCSNQGCKCLAPRKLVNSRYFYWQILAAQPVLEQLGRGSTFKELANNDLADFRLFAPPAETQSGIASFLDRETARLDGLVAQKEKLLALLKEKRASLITHAVTHGLNPQVPTKPSGIPWPSRIPTHWEVVRLGRRIELQRGVDITKDQQNEGTVPVVSSGGIASFHDVPLVAGPGVVVGRKGTAGAVYYIDSDYWPHDTTLYVKKFRGSHPRFVFYKLCSMDLASFDTGSANPTLNRNLLHPVSVAWPPLAEQAAIAGQLDRQTAKLDALATKIETAISLLRERRTAMISAAVTGQLDVRRL